MADLTTLTPSLIWEMFDKITRVPRPSKHEEQIRAWLRDFATSHAFEWKEDSTGNIVIRKPATEGYENHPTVVLQSHMDMVCEKNSAVDFDFLTEPIRTRIEEGWVKAEGTTLGADCGIGMAAQLAVLLDDTLRHPAIEALFTVDEETGLTGAFGLADDMLGGKYLINLDSEDEGELFIGCAGGVDTVVRFHYEPKPAPADYIWYRLNIGGLKGGHSGDNIDDGLGNSNKIMARMLKAGGPKLVVAQIDGGNLRNAIPREATALVGVPEESLMVQMSLVGDMCKAELRHTDSDLCYSFEPADAPEKVVEPEVMNKIVLSILGCPNGVLEMSRTMPGLVETSTNLASVKMPAEGEIVVTLSQRSSVESAKWAAAQSVGAVFTLAGGEVKHGEGYPGWEPNPDSALVAATVECYKELFATEPKVRAIHAGLECGLFLEKYPQLDMVSFGPTLRGVHSPDERLEIASVDKFWRLLTALLEKL